MMSNTPTSGVQTSSPRSVYYGSPRPASKKSDKSDEPQNKNDSNEAVFNSSNQQAKFDDHPGIQIVYDRDGKPVTELRPVLYDYSPTQSSEMYKKTPLVFGYDFNTTTSEETSSEMDDMIEEEKLRMREGKEKQ